MNRDFELQEALMGQQKEIINRLADDHRGQIALKVIEIMEKMTDDRQMGDDSRLKTMWDEFCVQVQDRRSIAWWVYENLVDELIMDELKKLPDYVQEGMWLASSRGQEWLARLQSVAEMEGGLPYQLTDIVRYVYEGVRSRAAAWTNAAIDEYLASCADS